MGYDTICIVNDKFTKFGHFIALKHPFSAASLAKICFDQLFKLHGAPASIVSNRDQIFTGIFWKELMKKLGSQLQFSFTYHPQSDGQIERLNQVLESYLRCMTSKKPKAWF